MTSKDTQKPFNRADLRRCVIDGDQYIFGEMDRREAMKGAMIVAIALPAAALAADLTGWVHVPGWVYVALAAFEILFIGGAVMKLKFRAQFIVSPELIRYEQGASWTDGKIGFEYWLDQCEYLASWREGEDDTLFLGGEDQIVWTLKRNEIGLSKASWEEVIAIVSHYRGDATRRAKEERWPMGWLGLKTRKGWVHRGLWELLGALPDRAHSA